MEKRMLVAMGLSLAVIVVFQVFFGSRAQRNLSQEVNTVTALPSSAAAPIAGESTIDLNNIPAVKEILTKYTIGDFSLDISNIGGEVKSVNLKKLKYEFPIESLGQLELMRGQPASIFKKDEQTIVISSTVNGLQIKKTIHAKQFQLGIDYEIINTSSQKKVIDQGLRPLAIDLSRLDNSVRNSDWTLFEYSIKTKNKILRKEHAHNFNEKWTKEENIPVGWVAFRDRYFVTLVAPEKEYQGYKTEYLDKDKLNFALISTPIELASGQHQKIGLTIYMGPQIMPELAKVSPGFEKVVVFSSWGWLDAIAKAIYGLLGIVHKVIPVWGLCIIIVSLMVYGGMYPLTLKSMTSMKKMQQVQPKIHAIKEKYKNDPERLNKETAELFRRENINPLSGCLPLLFQMPIFVGLYQVLWRSFYFRGDSFLWIKDLSMPDRLFRLPVQIPFIGEYFNILPLVMTGIMVVQQKITMSSVSGGDPDQIAQQRMMGTIMPVFLGVIFYNFSSGLNLYFVVFYSLSALSQWKINKTIV